jgi:2'-5' RNA ligase
MRLFTAIPLPNQTKESLRDICRNQLPINYLNTANLHITLNFIGDVEDDKLEIIKQFFLNNTDNQKSFQINLQRVIKFRQQIHIVITPSKELCDFQRKLDNAFKGISLTFENRAYYPHIKLANLRDERFLNQDKRLEDFPNKRLSEANFLADKVCLYESKLLMHYAHHNLLEEIKLIT